ncbi:MAG: tetratricopeptide repeat protein [Gemmatimonadetes bacterium]|nr:tetratricopeptide repeat protein [Gemmatimonadota bacterium]
MPKHPTAARVHKEASPDDAFIARVLETTAWARTHSRTLVIGGAVFVLAIAAVLYYRNYRSALREQSAVELLRVRQTAASGNIALARRDLETFIQRFSGTPSADEARLMLATVQLEMAQPDSAARTVGPLADDLDEPLGTSAAFLLAAAYEAQNKSGQAEATYLRIADEAEMPFERREALDAVGRLRLEGGNAAGAVQVYEQLVREAPEDTGERSLYEMRLAEARARATAPSGG